MKSISLLIAVGMSAVLTIPVSGQGRSPKRGLSFNSVSTADIELLESSTTWMYNWGSSLSGDAAGLLTSDIEYLPMAWSLVQSKETVLQMLDRNPGCEYFLGYNEPNLTDQCDKTPQEAAANWPYVVQACRERGVKIVSPAMNWGTKPGYSDPVKWFDEFFDIVGLESVDYIAYHAYMPGAQQVMNDIARLKKYGKPIWLTEFCAANGSITNNVGTQQAFMVDMLIALEKDPDVFRYAWFKERGSGNWAAISVLKPIGRTAEYTDLGKIYAAIPTFDKNYYHSASVRIPATQFIDWQQGGMSMGVETSDDCRDVVLTNLGRNAAQSISYQVEVAKAGGYKCSMLVAGGTGSSLEKICVDGEPAVSETVDMSTGGAAIWGFKDVEIYIPQGKHTITFYPVKKRAFKFSDFELTFMSGIEGVEMNVRDHFKVSGNSIVSDGTVHVYNMQGVEVGQDNLPRGIYIVNTPDGSVKVAL